MSTTFWIFAGIVVGVFASWIVGAGIRAMGEMDHYERAERDAEEHLKNINRSTK